MIEKKEGIINGIIHDNTAYNNSNNRYYPTINGLKFLIEELLSVNETTLYIKFNPYYVNSKLNCQIEFDEYMFYMECRDDFTEAELEEHWTRCMDNIYDIPHEIEQYKNMSEDRKKQAQILYPVCKHGDYQAFHKYLNNYKEYLNELIPMLFEKAKDNLNLTQDDMAFGYFCFEVHSG
ncbi:hypothetical protein [Anaerorhabdus sp.]|uniref:hypothetical protein n=1 Tax=Anaerorhabdus sp. TaxID=1872524 RepID=UPI002FCA760D